MKTNAEISWLWQFEHLKFHFGEELAIRAMNTPTTNLAYSADISPRSAEAPKFSGKSRDCSS
jgi:hypothetical protein